MNKKTKQAIIAYVAANDPAHDVVTLSPNADFSGGTVKFSPLAHQHREESSLKGEKYVEAYLLVRLCIGLKYRLDRVEMQKEYPVGHHKKDRPRIDILLKEPRDNGADRIFLYVEAKDPEKYAAEYEAAIQKQLYLLADHERANGLRYLLYFSVESDGVDLIEKVAIIDFEQFPTHDDWKNAGKPTLDLIPKDYGQARKAIYLNKPTTGLAAGEKSLDRRADASRFAALRRDIHNVLWGGGGMFYNDIFSNLVRIFLAKIYDEETTEPGQAYKFQIEMVGVTPESPSEIYTKVNNLFKNAQEHYLGYNDEKAGSTRGIDPEKIGDSKVAYVVERLQSLSLIENETSTNSDVLGNFFEGIVEQGFKQSRGQFFTHTNVVHFLLYAMGVPKSAVDLASGKENPAKPRLPYICDPACGSGTFLIEAMKIVTHVVQSAGNVKKSVRNLQFIESMFPPSKPNRWADTYLYGIEINADLALATKVNMVLHGDGNINVFAQDGLAAFPAYTAEDKVSALTNSERLANFPYTRQVNQQFDFIVTNPPFSIKPDAHTKEDYEKRFDFGSSARSENLFLERWYQLLKPGGRVGAVLPESVFDTPSGVETRLFLYRYFRVDALISLPYLAFKPYTSTKTCLLIATKKSNEDVAIYNSAWNKYLARFRLLMRRVKPYVAEAPSNGEKFASDPEETRSALAKFIGAPDSSVDSLRDRLTGLMEAGWSPPDEDHWIFSATPAELDYSIFFAEAEEVGYKRRKQGGDLIRENDLFARASDGTITPDLTSPKTVLDRLLTLNEFPAAISGFRSSFSDIGHQQFLRCDPKYRWFWDRLGGRAIDKSAYAFRPLSDLVTVQRKRVVKKGELEEERNLIELEDVESGTGRIVNVQTVEEIGSDKLELDDAAIVFSKLEPYLCKAFINDPECKYIGSTEWVALAVNEEVAVKEYIWAFLVSPLGRTVFRYLQSGKRHARINLEDFLKILVPSVPKKVQEKSVESIQPLWTRMSQIRDELRKTKKDADDAFLDSLE